MMAKLWKVEGGTRGSMHHRGPWHYATEAEAEAALDRDAYPSIHPAAGPGVALDYSEVEVPDGLVRALRAAVDLSDGWIDPAKLHAGGLPLLQTLGLCRDEETGAYPYYAPRVTDLGRQLAAAVVLPR
jgi:hypothetical protein